MFMYIQKIMPRRIVTSDIKATKLKALWAFLY